MVLIFLGDIYHNAYNSVTNGIRANNFAMKLMSYADHSFCVVGNHEFTYYTDNPFWTLLTEMGSPRIERFQEKKVWQPLGEIHSLDIVDEWVDGEVRFIFNHHGCQVHKPLQDGKVNIGLFHQDLYAQEIAEDMRKSLGLEIFEHTPVYFDKTGALEGYDYAFLGHMHMLYWRGKYICDLTKYETYLYYLSTLGRTNHLEVQDTFRERNIPAVIVDNGKFQGVEDNLFLLMSRSDSVIEEVVQMAQQKRAESVMRKRESEHIMINDDPITNLLTSLSGRLELHQMVTDVMSTGTHKHQKALRERVNRFVGRN